MNPSPFPAAGRRRSSHQPASRPVLPPLHSVKLLDRVRERIRLLHYSRRAEQACVHWCRAFIRFHGLRHPAEMGRAEVETVLTWLAKERGVCASTPRQPCHVFISAALAPAP